MKMRIPILLNIPSLSQNSFLFSKRWQGWRFGFEEWNDGGDVVSFGTKIWNDSGLMLQSV